MKPELKRIEAALQQLTNPLPSQGTVEPLAEVDAFLQQVEAGRYSNLLDETTLSVRIYRDAIASIPPSALENSSLPEAGLLETNAPSQFFTPSSDQAPSLPEFILLADNKDAESQHLKKNPSESKHPEHQRLEHQHLSATPQPVLALNLLKDLQATVNEWAVSLNQVGQQIQSLYEEGPIVDGWLESFKPGSETETGSETEAEYRLCGLNEDNHLWYRYCPAEQIADVSLAIVRFQRLQQLLTRKRSLETRLARFTELLIDAYGRVTELSQ